jgi:hypothetical protein
MTSILLAKIADRNVRRLKPGGFKSRAVALNDAGPVDVCAEPGPVQARTRLAAR